MAALSLAFDILARDQGATRTFNNVGDAADRAGKKGSLFGSAMKNGMKLAGAAIAGAGVAFAGFAAVSVKSLARIEMINAQTAAAIKSMGGAAGVTAKQVEDMAGALENATATEAESIQQGANLLLTFGNIKNAAGENNDIFNQTVAAMVDMSRAMDTTGAATLDQSSAAIQLGKALNDPIKGVTALQRVGVSFTAEQKKMIASLVESGDLMGAQKIILSELTNQFGGSAKAFAETTTGRIELAKHAIGTFGETITAAVLPVMGDLATKAADAFNGLAEGFENGTGAGGRLKDVVVGVKDAAVGLFNILFKGDFTGGLFGLEEDSKTVATLFAVRDAAMGFADAMRYLWEEGKKAADILITGLKPTWDQLALVWRTDLKPAFDELVGVLKDELGPLFEDASGEQGSFIEQSARLTVVLVKALTPSLIVSAKMVAFMAQSLASIIPVVVAVGRWIGDLAAKGFDFSIRMGTAIKNVVALVRAQLNSMGGQFVAIKNTVASAISSVIATVQALPGRILGAVGSFPSLLRNAGRSLIQGLINGIMDRIAGIRSAMSSVAQTIGNFLPGSPVKEGPLVKWNDGNAGKRLIDMGVVQPLNASTGAVASAMGGVAGAINMPTGPTAGPGRPIIVRSYIDGKLVAESVNTHLGDMAERSVYA